MSFWLVDRALPGVFSGSIMAAAVAVSHLLLRRYFTRTTERQTATLTGAKPETSGDTTMTAETAAQPPPGAGPQAGSLYRHLPHPHIAARAKTGPVKVADQIPRGDGEPGVRGWYAKANAWLAVKVTAGVGSMSCAWLFCLLAIAGLPTALQPGNIGFLFWFSSDLLQLTLLSVIIVGQNIQASAADKRAEQTYRDAEAVLAEALKIQEHLAAQDGILTKLAAAIQEKEAAP